jgi:hypothetical protein
MREILLRSQDLQFKQPFTCIVIGHRGPGKSSLCIRLLQHLDTLCTEHNFHVGIVWCYSETSTVPTHELAVLGNKIRYHEGVPTKFVKATGGLPSLLILDNLLNEAYSREVCDLFRKGSNPLTSA